MSRAFTAAGLSTVAIVAACSSAPDVGQTTEPLGTSTAALTGDILVDGTDGDDANDGATAPVRTIRRAMRVVPPGGRVLIRPGRYVERVNVTQSKISIMPNPAYRGVVHVDGGAPIRVEVHNPPQPDDENEQVYRYWATFRLKNVVDVTITGLKITHDQNAYCSFPDGCLTIGEQAAPWGSCARSCDGTCNADGTCTECGQSDPDLTLCQCGLKPIAAFDIDGTSRHIRIEKNEITDVRRATRQYFDSYAVPVLIGGYDGDAAVTRDIKVLGNRFHDLTNEDIDGNGFFSGVLWATGNSQAIEMGGNTFERVAQAIAVAGNYGYAQAPGSLSIPFDRARDVLIHDNTMTDVNNTAIYVDGAQRVLIERNLVKASRYGIGIVTEVIRNDTIVGAPDLSTVTREVWVRDNIVAESPLALAVGMWLATPKRAHYNPVFNVAVSNNTFTGTPEGNGSLVVLLPGIQGSSSYRLNIASARLARVASVSRAQGFPSSLFCTTDHWYATGYPNCEVPVQRFVVDGVDTNLAGFLGALPDSGARFVDPKFLNPTSTTFDRYRLGPQSPGTNGGPIQLYVDPLWAPPWATGYPFDAPERDAFGEARVNTQASLNARIDVGADEL